MKITERMTAADYRAMIGAPEPAPGAFPRFRQEIDFQWWLRGQAHQFGWLYNHNGDSRHADLGYPDTTLLNGPHLCFAELKMPSTQPTPTQRRWLDALARAQFRIRCHFTCLWRPAYVPAILAYLADPAHTLPPNVWRPTSTPEHQRAVTE